MKVLLLGKNGMLGNAVYREISNIQSADLINTTKSSEVDAIKFDALHDPIFSLIESIKPNYVINCIGMNWNQGKKSLTNLRKTFEINSIFPRKLASAANKLNTQVIQILTDGVFSGKQGQYHEKSLRNTVTIYGQSKKMGEIFSKNVLGLRCSIIGEQFNFNQHYLLQWLKSQPKNSSIEGYENYFWNGITTKAFARIVSGMITHESKIFGKYHLTPADFVSKFELLTLLAHKYDRDDIQIKKTRLRQDVDRTLDTNYPKQNLWFWEAGGYKNLPSIKELVNEL
jgi:dTDP-4-dehydrorhamnose reductase